MKKTVKILLWILAVIIGGALLLLLTTPLWLGPVSAAVANGVAPKITGTPFKITKMHLNPISGNFAMEGFHLGNPKGYDAEDAVSLGKLSVSVSPMSLLGKKLHIKNIDIIDPYISYLGENGTNNFDAIIANIKKNLNLKEEEEKEEDDDKDKMKVVIDRFHIEGIKLKMGIMPTLPIPIPITLTDLGSKDEEGKETDGITVEEMGSTLASQISSACSKAGGSIMSIFGGDAAKSVGDGVSNAASAATDAAGKAADAATDAASKAADAATDAAKSVGEGAKNLLKGAGNLLGGDKDKK